MTRTVSVLAAASTIAVATSFCHSICVPSYLLRAHSRIGIPIPLSNPVGVRRVPLHHTSASFAHDEKEPVILRHTAYDPRAPYPNGATAAGPSRHGNAPVILLHGLLGNRRNFATIASALSSGLTYRPRTIYALDLRNHGENGSDTWKESMTYRDMAADLVHTLDSLKVEKCVLVGHSMGGKVAQAAALLYPERIEGLCVMDIAPVRYSESSDPSWANIRSIIDAMQSIDFSGSKRDADQLLRSHIDDLALRAFVLTNLEDLRESGGVRWKINIGAISRRLHEIADFDIFSLDDDCLSDDHPVYHGDTFYINGGVSRYVRHSHMPTIGQLFPNHMLTTVRGAGHWVHAEAPDDTIALLKTYLER